MWNIRICKMFICNGIPKHWRLSLVQVRNVYWLLEFSLSTQGERNTFFTMLTVPSDPTTCGASRSPNWTGFAQHKNQIASSSVRSQLTAFSKITKILSPSLPGMTSFAPQSHFLSGVFIMTSVIFTSSAHEREHLRSMCAPARALSRIVLSLTKPNDKI